MAERVSVELLLAFGGFPLLSSRAAAPGHIPIKSEGGSPFPTSSPALSSVVFPILAFLRIRLYPRWVKSQRCFHIYFSNCQGWTLFDRVLNIFISSMEDPMYRSMTFFFPFFPFNSFYLKILLYNLLWPPPSSSPGSFPCEALGLPLSVVSIPSEAALERINSSFASSCQLKVASGLRVGACVTSPLSTRTRSGLDLWGSFNIVNSNPVRCVAGKDFFPTLDFFFITLIVCYTDAFSFRSQHQKSTHKIHSRYIPKHNLLLKQRNTECPTWRIPNVLDTCVTVVKYVLKATQKNKDLPTTCSVCIKFLVCKCSEIPWERWLLLPAYFHA